MTIEIKRDCMNCKFKNTISKRCFKCSRIFEFYNKFPLDKPLWEACNVTKSIMNEDADSYVTIKKAKIKGITDDDFKEFKDYSYCYKKFLQRCLGYKEYLAERIANNPAILVNETDIRPIIYSQAEAIRRGSFVKFRDDFDMDKIFLVNYELAYKNHSAIVIFTGRFIWEYSPSVEVIFNIKC